jgi:hypothetical protein
LTPILIVSSFLIAAYSVQAAAVPIQWTQASGGNGHYYEFFGSANVSWSQAKSIAESLTFAGSPGYLATITSAAENQFISANMGVADYWIGLTDSESFGGRESQGQADPLHQGWVWVTGEPVAYVNWRSGEPNNEFNNEDGVEIYGSQRTPTAQWLGLWNDENSNSSQGYIVEYVPEPGSIKLAMSCAGPLSVWLLCRARKNRRRVTA